jgi:hypothetical protein
MRRRREGEEGRGAGQGRGCRGRALFSCSANEKGHKQKVDRATTGALAALIKGKPPEEGKAREQEDCDSWLWLKWRPHQLSLVER